MTEMTRRCLLAAPVLGLSVVLAAGATPTPRRTAGVQAFVDVAVLPMDTERVLLHQTVLVADGRITALGPTAEVSVPSGATRIGGAGRYLIPGLGDAHVHLVSPIELPLYVASGVTTVLNLNGRPQHLLWRRWIAEGQLVGPNILSTGPMFDRVRSPEEAVREVDEQAAAGYDGVKVYFQVSREEYPALAVEAKRKGLLLTGHVARGPGFEATLAAGQSIAHAEEFTYTFFNPRGDDEDAHIEYDSRRIPEAVRLTANAAVFVTPTLSMYRDIIRQATGLGRYLESPQMALLPPGVRASLSPGNNRYHGRWDAEGLRRLEVSLAFQRKLVLALQEAGVPLLTGTDATTIGPVAGVSLHDELLELVKSGLSPWQALQASSANLARYLRRDDIGTIAVGKRADLVLLAADPLADIEASRQIEGVMLGGRFFDRAELERMRQAVPPAYAAELAGLVARIDEQPDAVARSLAERDPAGVLGAALLAEVLTTQGRTRFRDLLRETRARAAGPSFAGEEAVNTLGYQLLGAGRSADALAAFEANVEGFPNSANARDSLAETYFKLGETARAVETYARALELDPHYPNAESARRFIAEHGGRPASAR